MVASAEVALLNRHLRSRARGGRRSRSRGSLTGNQRVLGRLGSLGRCGGARRSNHRLHLALGHRLRAKVKGVLTLEEQVAVTHDGRLRARKSVRSRGVYVPGAFLNTRQNRRREGVHLGAGLRSQGDTRRERLSATGLHQVIHRRRKVCNGLVKTRHRIHRKCVGHLRLRRVTRRVINGARLIVQSTLKVGVLHRSGVVLTVVGVTVRVSARLRARKATTLVTASLRPRI